MGLDLMANLSLFDLKAANELQRVKSRRGFPQSIPTIPDKVRSEWRLQRQSRIG